MVKKFFRSIYLLLILYFSVSACTTEEEVVDLNPNSGASFLDIENEGYVVNLNAVPAADKLTGTWRVYVGENGHFSDAHNPYAEFYGEPGETYQLGWEVSDGERYEASMTTVSFKAMEPVITHAIKDTLYNNVSLYLEAEMPKYGASGRWEIVSGKEGRIENENNHFAEFVGIKNEEYHLKWILSYGSKEVETDIHFVTDTLKAFAGEDQLDVKNNKKDEIKFFTLEGFLPAGANGEWSILNGENGVIYTPDNPHSVFQGIADSLYTLTWKVTLDGVVSTDTVDIRFRGKWGVWEDDRDGQTYRYAEINGLEWMADNYNYALNPGVDSWYYGHAPRSVIHDGIALETEEERKAYGRLYSREGATYLAPEGWRLPTEQEVADLIQSLGGPVYAQEKIEEGGETGFDLKYTGFLEISSREDDAFRNVFLGQDVTAMFWTSTYAEKIGFSVTLYMHKPSKTLGLSLAPAMFYALPVRYVREVQD